MFTKRYSMNINEANNAITLLNIIKIIPTIPLSMLVDKCGRNVAFLGAAVSIAVLAHSLILFRMNPYACMVNRKL